MLIETIRVYSRASETNAKGEGQRETEETKWKKGNGGS